MMRVFIAFTQTVALRHSMYPTARRKRQSQPLETPQPIHATMAMI